MRRTTFSIAIILLFTFPLAAQVTIEVQGGLNIANLSDPGNLVEGAVWSSRPGLVTSLSMSIHMAEKLLLSPRLRFVQKGTKSEWSWSSTEDINGTITNNYLELPVYFQWQAFDFGPRLFVTSGPAFSYLLSSRAEATSTMHGYSSRDSRNDYKSYDASFDLGISLRSGFSNNVEFLATGFYSFGFIKISDRGSNEQSRDIRFLIGLSYSPSN